MRCRLVPSESFTVGARRIGVLSAVGVASAVAVYAVTLVAGLLALESPQEPVGDPLFSVLEILILLLMPMMLVLLGAVHAWASRETRVFSLLALVFMSLVAGISGSVHFVILTVGRDASFSQLAWTPSLLAFRWPSVAYALDILAWDVFFALSVLCAALVFRGGDRLITWIRRLLMASGVLAAAGLSGVVVGSMELRNLGVVGYAGVFPIAAVLLAIVFYRTDPTDRRL